MIFDGDTVRVRDLKGMRYLARLLAEPGREFHVLDLVAAEVGTDAQGDSSHAAGLPRSGPGDAGDMLDTRAKEAYRRRLSEIDDIRQWAERTQRARRRAPNPCEIPYR